MKQVTRKQWFQWLTICFVALIAFIVVIPLGIAQVNSVQSLGDVAKTDPEFQALQSVVERYGLNVGFPDRTFRGKQPLTRGDFVIYLSDAMDLITELLSASTADFPSAITITNDLEVASRQLDSKAGTFSTRLERIKMRLAALEARATKAKASADKGDEDDKRLPAYEVGDVQQIAKLPIPPPSAVKDVTPSDRYYAALKNILERHNINVVLPNLTFQGDQPLTRGDFAIYFNAALDRLDSLQASAFAPIREAQQSLDRLQNQFNTSQSRSQKEIEVIKQRLNLLEQKLSR